MRTLIFIALAALAFSCTTTKKIKKKSPITHTVISDAEYYGAAYDTFYIGKVFPTPTIEELDRKFDFLPLIDNEVVIVYIGDGCCFLPENKCRMQNDLKRMSLMPELRGKRIFTTTVNDKVGLLLYDRWSWVNPHRPTPQILCLKRGCRIWPVSNLKDLVEEVQRIEKFRN